MRKEHVAAQQIDGRDQEVSSGSRAGRSFSNGRAERGATDMAVMIAPMVLPLRRRTPGPSTARPPAGDLNTHYAGDRRRPWPPGPPAWFAEKAANACWVSATRCSTEACLYSSSALGKIPMPIISTAMVSSMATSRASSLLPASPPYALILRQGKKPQGHKAHMAHRAVGDEPLYIRLRKADQRADRQHVRVIMHYRRQRGVCAEETTWAAERSAAATVRRGRGKKCERISRQWRQGRRFLQSGQTSAPAG